MKKAIFLVVCLAIPTPALLLSQTEGRGNDENKAKDEALIRKLISLGEETWNKHDAEALLVHPRTGNLYIVTKVLIANPVVYEAVAPFTAGRSITMRRVGEPRVPSLFGGAITGGSISPDGRSVALCDYFSGYELVLPAGASNFDDIWKQKMIGFDLGKRKQGESITYRLDGKALLATSEGKQAPLIQVERNR